MGFYIAENSVITIFFDGQCDVYSENTLPAFYSTGTQTLQESVASTIQVPGAWEAQGFGHETTQMKTQVVTGDNAAGDVIAQSVQIIFIIDSYSTPASCL